MKKSSWKITTYDEGRVVGSAEGLDHTQAVAAIRGAMYGTDPLTEGTSFARALAAVAVKRQEQLAEHSTPVAA